MIHGFLLACLIKFANLPAFCYILSAMAGVEEIKNGLEERNSFERQDAVTFFWEVVKIVLISLAIIVPVRYYLIQPFFVKGASMEENFDDGDYVLIDEISFRFRQPQRGEVIVFRAPREPSQFYIKRIIGLPGEIIQIKNNQVTIFNSKSPNGFVLEESAYLSEEIETVGDLKVNIGPNEYFVLGDNREHSSDSRVWGSVGENLISGKVFFRAWPFNKVTKF